MSQKTINIQRPKAPTPETWVSEKAETPQGPTKRLTFDVSADLHKRIKMTCTARDQLMAEVLREILEKAFPKEG